MNQFEQEIRAFFKQLNEHQVKYLLVGGLAVNCYGYSRSTGDIDLWMKDSSPNRSKLVKALKAYEVEGAEIFLELPDSRLLRNTTDQRYLRRSDGRFAVHQAIRI